MDLGARGLGLALALAFALAFAFASASAALVAIRALVVTIVARSVALHRDFLRHTAVNDHDRGSLGGGIGRLGQSPARRTDHSGEVGVQDFRIHLEKIHMLINLPFLFHEVPHALTNDGGDTVILEVMVSLKLEGEPSPCHEGTSHHGVEGEVGSGVRVALSIVEEREVSVCGNGPAGLPVGEHLTEHVVGHFRDVARATIASKHQLGNVFHRLASRVDQQLKEGVAGEFPSLGDPDGSEPVGSTDGMKGQFCLGYPESATDQSLEGVPVVHIAMQKGIR